MNKLTPMKIDRIRYLLESSELRLPEIAERMGVAKSTVIVINNKYQIRQYCGNRSTWVLKTK